MIARMRFTSDLGPGGDAPALHICTDTCRHMQNPYNTNLNASRVMTVRTRPIIERTTPTMEMMSKARVTPGEGGLQLSVRLQMSCR